MSLLDKALRILHEFESSFQPRTRTNHSRTIQSVDVFREEGGQPMAYLVNMQIIQVIVFSVLERMWTLLLR